MHPISLGDRFRGRSRGRIVCLWSRTDRTDWTNALNATISLAPVVSTKTAFVIAAFHRREAAEALKARNIPAQGKHAESVRRPGCNGDYIRVPRPLWPQSAKLTGAKGAMELTFLLALSHPSRVLSRRRTLTWGCACGATPGWYVTRFQRAKNCPKSSARFQRAKNCPKSSARF